MGEYSQHYTRQSNPTQEIAAQSPVYVGEFRVPLGTQLLKIWNERYYSREMWGTFLGAVPGHLVSTSVRRRSSSVGTTLGFEPSFATHSNSSRLAHPLMRLISPNVGGYAVHRDALC